MSSGGKFKSSPPTLCYPRENKDIAFRIKNYDGSQNDSTLYRLEFTLDADCSCFVQIHFNARELYQDGEIQYVLPFSSNILVFSCLPLVSCICGQRAWVAIGFVSNASAALHEFD